MKKLGMDLVFKKNDCLWDDVSKLLSFENTQLNLVFCSLIRNFAPDDESVTCCLINITKSSTHWAEYEPDVHGDGGEPAVVAGHDAETLE